MAEPEDDGGVGVPAWVVTYGDMMSLLLTFFIMLVSMSEMKDDAGKVRAMLNAIREAFGPTMGQSGVPGKSLQTNSAMKERGSRGARSEGGIGKYGRKSGGRAGPHRTVKRIDHGTVVTMGGPTLFEPFDASLPPALRENLDIIVKVIGSKPNRLMVRGHASPEPLPPESPFRDQFDLSFARAWAVAQYLISKGVDRRRLLISAAGDTEPRSRTREKASQKVNRRVDVFLIDSYIKHPRRADSPDRLARVRPLAVLSGRK
jgi:chemotaxis protein MotB